MSVETTSSAGARAAVRRRRPLLRLTGIKKYFPIKQGIIFQKAVGNVHAVDGVDLEIYPGETVGLVGETGCGKSTLARVVMRLYDATEGQIIFDGQDITSLSGRKLRDIRREVQMIFQDPYASLNSRKTVGSIIAEPYLIHKTVPEDKIKGEVQQLMELVGLNPEHYNRYPHEFSGGQRQRIGVARALALKPKLIVCDEPVSALDVSIQAQILNLLEDLQAELNLTYLFIAHDLSVVKHVSDRVAVMYLGKIVEMAPGDTLYRDPKHPVHGGAAVGRADPGPEHRLGRSAGSSWRATCPHRSTRRPGAGSTRAARGPSCRSARPKSRSSRRITPARWRPASSRSRTTPSSPRRRRGGACRGRVGVRAGTILRPC